MLRAVVLTRAAGRARRPRSRRSPTISGSALSTVRDRLARPPASAAHAALTAHGGKHNITSDASSNYHDYTIDWQEDELRLLIDNQEVRSIKKADTKNAATGVFEYPTTPSRVQFRYAAGYRRVLHAEHARSLWPAGINSSAQGTIDWSGGNINWKDPDYVSAGHFYALLKSVKITCAKTGAAATKAGDVSYVYGANVSGIPSVLSSNQSAVSAAAAVLASGLHALAPLAAAFAIAASALML